MPDDPDGLLSVAQAAALLGVHPRTLRRWIAAGRLRGYRMGPHMLRVRRSELEDVLRPLNTARPRRR